MRSLSSSEWRLQARVEALERALRDGMTLVECWNVTHIHAARVAWLEDARKLLEPK